jgi:hypothetical protein
MIKDYSITKEKREIYKGIIILNEMINNHRKFPIVGDSNIDMLKTLLTSMSAKELVEIKNNEFVPTEKGRENLLNFYKKFWESIKIFQIFSAVDLTNGTFAYSDYWNMDEDKFLAYINQSNFDDVRIAVAEFKKIDPIELVFMDFLSKNTIDVSSDDWAFQIMSDLVWSEIIEICENAIHVEELEEGDAIINIIKQGSELAIDLIKQEDELLKQAKEEDAKNAEIEANQNVNNNQDYYVEEVVEEYYEPDYYYGYYDPFYISPIWLMVLI